MLLCGAACMIQSLGVFEPPRAANPSQKFIKSAFGWLLIAGLLLAFETVHLNKIAAPFSHAYTGAIRHAVTVGFISQMIIGVSYHLVTRMLMLNENRIPQLWSVFWLLNIGNCCRVALEVWTDYTRTAFAPMGFTGFVELIGLGIWAWVMIGYIRTRSISLAASC